jgi:hypothetical protein
MFLYFASVRKSILPFTPMQVVPVIGSAETRHPLSRIRDGLWIVVWFQDKGPNLGGCEVWCLHFKELTLLKLVSQQPAPVVQSGIYSKG